MEKKYADLHMHTFYSDGVNDVGTLVRANKLLGIEVMAIADHDTMAAWPELEKLAEDWNMEVIPAVEVSTEKYHILGFGVDYKDNEFQEFLEEIRGKQAEHCARRIEVLQKQGVPMTFEKLRNAFPGSRLGKYNILMAMMRDSECLDYMNAEYPGLYSEDYFNIYLRKGPAGKVKSSGDVTGKEAIEAIHKAGGKAVVAHPFKQAKDVRELDELVEAGLDGLEVQPNYGERNDPFRKYAEDKGLMITYGSDYHGPMMERGLLGRKYNIMSVEDIERLKGGVLV